MTKHPDPPIVDPDRPPEILCLGRVNVTLVGSLATLTFTHPRPKANELMNQQIIEYESIIRTRIVTSIENLVAIKEVVDDLVAKAAARRASGQVPDKQHH